MRTAVSSRFRMRSCEIPKRSHRQMTRSCRSLRSLAVSALGLCRVQVAANFHDSCRLCRNCRVHCLVGSNSMLSSRSTRWWTCCQEVMLRLTRKGEWWQFHGRSAAEISIGCAAVMPPAESFFTDSCAHDQQRQQTTGRTMETVGTNRRSTTRDRQPLDLTRLNV